MLLIRPTGSQNFVRGWIDGRHRGMDWGWQRSAIIESMTIRAAAPGVVVSVYEGDGYNEGWGRRIIIEHAPGVRTTYNHLRPGGVLVRVGDRVYAGQLIGWMGSSGASTGTHLHFELYLNGVRVDPAPYFTKHLPGTEPEQPAGGGGKPLPQPNPETDALPQEEDTMKMFAYFNPADPNRPTYVTVDFAGGCWDEQVTNDEDYARDWAYKWTNNVGIPTFSVGHRNSLRAQFEKAYPGRAPSPVKA